MSAHLTHWRKSEFHRRWLMQRAEDLFDFYQPNCVNPQGGFYELDDHAKPLAGEPIRHLVWTTRFVHCFSIGHLLGRPGAADLVDHGMKYIQTGHRDAKNGGYFNATGNTGPTDSNKQAYSHAFVLLAASSAKVAGHPDADRLIEDITQVLLTRFWEKSHGLSSEEYAADWSKISDYRGQNSNMHLTEALMAAFEATANNLYLDMATSIAQNLIQRITAHNGWRLPEHFTSSWIMNDADQGNPVFRPPGSTPGHWLEWARLLLQLWELGGRQHGWMVQASKALFKQSITEGWDAKSGGFYYTVTFDGKPLNPDRIWWPACEGIGAATYLANLDPDPLYESWYQKLWSWTDAHVLNKDTKGWHMQLGEDIKPKQDLFVGQPDMYHALQASLIPLFPTHASLTRVISEQLGK